MEGREGDEGGETRGKRKKMEEKADEEGSSVATTTPRLHGDLLIDEILTRLPTADAVRFRSVCRAWDAAITSDAFGAARSAARQPEILFFPPAGGAATTFYTCSLLPDAAATTTASELVTLGGLAGEYLMLSPKPCRGLTVVFEVHSSVYYLCNLTTGDHVALPRYDAAEKLGSPFHPIQPPWTPLENSSTGVGFDPATGEYKVVRLFVDRRTHRVKCEVYTLGSRGWRPCAGDVPGVITLDGLPPVAVDGSFYWLANPSTVVWSDQQRAILSLSIDTEQFGWVDMPPHREEHVRHLASLDGSLCAVVHGQQHRRGTAGDTPRVIELLTWSRARGTCAPSWSTRCRIDLDSLPRAMSDELDHERRTILPLCTAGGKILLATGRHKVFAYDGERNNVEKVFSMYDYVDFPDCHSEGRLLINILLHEESLVSVSRPAADGSKRLQVKRGGGDTVCKREKHRS